MPVRFSIMRLRIAFRGLWCCAWVRDRPAHPFYTATAETCSDDGITDDTCSEGDAAIHGCDRRSSAEGRC